MQIKGRLYIVQNFTKSCSPFQELSLLVAISLLDSNGKMGNDVSVTNTTHLKLHVRASQSHDFL